MVFWKKNHECGRSKNTMSMAGLLQMIRAQRRIKREEDTIKDEKLVEDKENKAKEAFLKLRIVDHFNDFQVLHYNYVNQQSMK